MGRNQKNTVKHYLNTRLNPKIVQVDGRKTEAYPVYIKIRAQQKQTQIKSSYWVFRIDSFDEIPNVDKYSHVQNDDSFSYLTVSQFESDEKIKEWLKREENYYLKSINIITKLFNHETLDIGVFTKKLPVLTYPLQLLISEIYKSKLKNSLISKQHHNIIKIIDWHWNSFWEIMSGLISVMDGVVYSRSNYNNVLQVVNEYIPVYMILNDISVITSKQVIWVMEWHDVVEEFDLINRLLAESEKGTYSKDDLRNFLSEVSGEISKLTTRVLLDASM
ncbi:hypothetical protein OB69_02770 [Roseivirga seohaensis subsp. aquiponti]|uniref:Uncharacterized protein n=1 Tax=Roseivirga seohaensis subsp. aquiponti TaxID=1566026 RepID=A0A0L8ANM9_9BACT|nr:hypothetical protein [Roseivirga seohaensis]KOF03949.1 hypothetical protein OB69_02770 [Roseivirga seohaensis subsp. aquiponti]